MTGEDPPRTNEERDPRRKFTASQARYLFERARGRCERCGRPLPEGWHAHHVRAHAAGGPTDVFNGQALCPQCHQEISMGNEFRPRLWQVECLDDFREVILKEGKRVYALEACMASGKS